MQFICLLLECIGGCIPASLSRSVLPMPPISHFPSQESVFNFSLIPSILTSDNRRCSEMQLGNPYPCIFVLCIPRHTWFQLAIGIVIGPRRLLQTAHPPPARALISITLRATLGTRGTRIAACHSWPLHWAVELVLCTTGYSCVGTF